MKYRYRFVDQLLDLRILIRHPMNQIKKDQAALFINLLTVKQNDRIVFQAHPTPSVSKNPYFRVQLQDIDFDDVLSISWRDNQDGGDETQFVIQE